MKSELIVYLPIGSIVLLNQSPKKLMITGTCVAMKEDKDNQKIFDYMACLWPEGIIDTDKNFLFNHQDIKEVVFESAKTEEDFNNEPSSQESEVL